MPKPDQPIVGLEALARLIEIAQKDTGQSRRVADFLLAWHNAAENGGWDMGYGNDSVQNGPFGLYGFRHLARSYFVIAGDGLAKK